MFNKAKYIIYSIISVALIFCITNCSSNKKNPDEIRLTASISPIKYIVETITCGDFPVDVMVPAGASPESYSPTVNQMVDIERSGLIFTTGLLDFEQELVSKLSGDPQRIINLSKGIALLEGSCSHITDNHSHNHGIDPHVWTSPKQLKVMATNAYNAISTAFPDSVKYKSAYDNLIISLDSLSNQVDREIKASGVKYFIIYHPALTYLARDYGLTQLSLEDEGKEPSAQHMRYIVDTAQKNNIKDILYQKQFSRSVVEAVAKEINAQPVDIEPLTENITEEILRITNIITAQK